MAFVVGLLASAFSSADSALTALTTSTCVDLLETQKMKHELAFRTRRRVHLGMTVLLWIVIMAFRMVNDTSVVAALFTAANYTYGPLLGLFSVGMFTTWNPRTKIIPWVCVLAPALGYGIEHMLLDLFNFSFGFALLPINGLLTALGLALISQKRLV